MNKSKKKILKNVSSTLVKVNYYNSPYKKYLIVKK